MGIPQRLLHKLTMYRQFGKQAVFACQPITYRGVGTLTIYDNGGLHLGWPQTGFTQKNDPILINNNGLIAIKGKVEIAAGCRIDITNEKAIFSIEDSYINCNALIIISECLTINSGCSVSWGCQFLDDDFHEIHYEGKKNQAGGIELGKHVWVGCNVKIYKGVRIADGCVIASDSVVKGVFEEKNCLIAGNPAKVIKQNISWQ